MQYLEERKHSKGIFKKFFKADNILPFFFFLLLIYAILSLLFSQNNIFKYFKAKKTEQVLIDEINSIKKDNLLLMEKIRDLKTDDYIIEKKAREELGLVKDGDEIYIIFDEKPKKEESKNRWIDKIKNIYKEYYLKK